MVLAYLGPNLLSHLPESLADRFHRPLSFKDYGATWTTAHVNGSLGSPRNVSQDVPKLFLHLPAGEHLRRCQAELFHVFAG